MRPFADPIVQRQLQRLVADVHPRGPQVIVQLLTDVAGRIGGQPAVIAALEELAVTSRPRRGLRSVPATGNPPRSARLVSSP